MIFISYLRLRPPARAMWTRQAGSARLSSTYLNPRPSDYEPYQIVISPNVCKALITPARCLSMCGPVRGRAEAMHWTQSGLCLGSDCTDERNCISGSEQAVERI